MRIYTHYSMYIPLVVFFFIQYSLCQWLDIGEQGVGSQTEDESLHTTSGSGGGRDCTHCHTQEDRKGSNCVSVINKLNLSLTH